MENFEKEKSLSLADLLGILRSGLVWIIVITILSTVIGGVYAFFVKKQRRVAPALSFVTNLLIHYVQWCKCEPPS